MPQSYEGTKSPKPPFPWGTWTLLTTHHPKWNPDPLSCFATMHFLDRQTDSLGEKPVPRVLTLECDALKRDVKGKYM